MIVSRGSGVFARKWIWPAALAIVALLAALWRPTIYAPLKRKPNLVAVSQPPVRQSPRKVFPFSVIRGGAFTDLELARARRTDPVIDAHYASFGSHPVFKKTPRDLLMYVSYRQGKDVYWSQTRHLIPKGETVIADGSSLARARCGNRLSATPQAPVAIGKQPPEEVLNTPEAPEEPLSYDLAVLQSPQGAPFPFVLPLGSDTPLSSGAPAAGGTGGGGSAAPGGGGGGFPGGAAPGGGAGPLLDAKRSGSTTAAGAPILGGLGLVNGPIPSPVQGVTIGSNGLPTSPNYPITTTRPSDTVTGLTPEPSPLGTTALALVFLFLLRCSCSSRFLRG